MSTSVTLWYASDKDKYRWIRGEEFLEGCKVGDIVRFTEGTISKPIYKDFVILSKNTNTDPIKLENGDEISNLFRHIHGIRIFPDGKEGKTKVHISQVNNVFQDSVKFSFSRR